MANGIEAVFARTLLGDYDDDAPWTAVRELQQLATREVLERAAEWCRSPDPLKRARGADVLAQLGRTPDDPATKYRKESYEVIFTMTITEKDLVPLRSAIHALGHLGDPRAVPVLSLYENHPDAEIRFALACALGNFTEHARAIDVLVQLTRDEDEEVRDWATFGIGSLAKSDSPAIRDALMERLDDPFEEAREEAIAGLARLKDARVAPALLSALERPDVPEIMIEAALELLGFSESPGEWTADKCVAELRRRYGGVKQGSGVRSQG